MYQKDVISLIGTPDSAGYWIDQEVLWYGNIRIHLNSGDIVDGIYNMKTKKYKK